MRDSTTSTLIHSSSIDRLLALCGLCAVLSGCAAHHGAEAPPPVPLLAKIPAPPVSVLRLPVEVDLDYARNLAMKAAPKPLSQGTVRKSVQLGSLAISPEVGVEFRHRAELQALDVRMDGDQLQAVARIAFSVGSSVQGGGLGVGVGSCGEKPGEPPALVDFIVRGGLAWGDGGKVVFRPLPAELRWVRSCQLTAAKIRLEDVLDLPIVRERVQTAIDQAILKLPDAIRIRPLAEQAWRELDKPRPVLPGVSLVMRPESLSLGPVSGTGHVLHASIALRARPALTDSILPTDTGRALPPIRLEPDAAGAFVLQAQASVPLPIADSILTARLSSQTFHADGRDVKISKARIYGAGDKAVLGVTLTKPFAGEIFLQGKPEYDSVSQSIRFADMDYDLRTSSFLTRSASFLLHGTILDAIQKAAVVDMKKFLPKLSDHRVPAGEAGEVRVSITSLRPMGISLDEGHLRLWLQAQGEALAKVGPVRK